MVAINIENIDVYFRPDKERRPAIDAPSRTDRVVDEEGQRPEIDGGLVRALDRVDLRVRDGETLAVLGPSGCGKSSLLRAVAGLANPRAGRIYFDGVEVTEDSPGSRKVGVVFQDYALYPHMEGRSNLSFFFKVNRREDEIAERVEEVCRIMGSGFRELLDRKPRNLSGGEKQRVAVGRCIIRDPTVFLLDEPLSNLDARLRASLRIDLKRLLRHFGVTTIYITHDQSEAIALADRIALMQSGQIVQVGTYRELYDRPHNTFVAGFLGEPAMNLIPATVRDGHIRIAGQTLPPLPGAGLRILEGEDVTVGIRPEHVEFPAREPTGAINAEVESIQALVSDRAQLTTFLVGNTRIAARGPVDGEVRRGDRIRLHFPAERLRTFDGRGIRIG
ncbi:MAG TPA: ABC transporter ATP-binding protein [Chloroflexota bacterium]|nr:ABC transporter ATP-binding protein [Chloroflexota bacterium]